MVKILTEPGGAVTNKEDIKVVGHRVVHGGPKISQPIIIDAAGEAIIEENILLAPLHNPANLLGQTALQGEACRGLRHRIPRNHASRVLSLRAAEGAVRAACRPTIRVPWHQHAVRRY